MPPAPQDPLATLVALLRQAGLDPSPEELSDILWLARWVAPAREAPPDPELPPAPRSKALATDRPPDGAEDGAGTPGPQESVPEAGEPDRVTLYPASTPGGRPTGQAERAAPDAVLPVRVPAAGALPGLLDLQRVLRPLQGFRPPAPPVRRVLDEEATAERSALTGLVIPVFQSVARHETTMQLLMDASPSMVVWERMLEEVRQVCEQLGAFRDVQVHYLHRAPDGAPVVGSSRAASDPRSGGYQLRGADQLRDPTGRRLTLVVSDCTGPLWRSGQAQRLLGRWARHAPVAVLQPLPQRLWARTALPAEPGRLMRDAGPAAHMEFRADRPRRGRAQREPAPDALPVPVLPPTKVALGGWARLLSGPGPTSARGAVAWVRADHHPASPLPQERPRPAADRLVQQFRSAASPAAAQLAVYLSAAPLTLPVMQLVQRTMLPGTGPTELAEVLLSGLLSRIEPTASAEGEQWYEFAEGVRDLLLRPLARDEAALVLKHCSEYVERHFGKGARNFPALAIAHLSGVPGHEPAGDRVGRPAVRVPQPFAEVSARVVRRYLPLTPESLAQAAPGSADSVRIARELVERYDKDGAPQSLLDAVQVLRRGIERHDDQPYGGRAETELAEALLRLWHLQGDPGLLREARQAATEAVRQTARPPTAPASQDQARARLTVARDVLGRILHESARDRLAAGDREAAAELLGAAEQEFNAVCALFGMDASALLEPTLRRAAVLDDLWRLRGDPVFLREAAVALHALVEAGPLDTAPRAVLDLRLGRVMLALAQSASDEQAAGEHAASAVEYLSHGLAALVPDPEDPRRRCEALLDLAEALQYAAGDAPAYWDDVLEVLDEARGVAGDTALQATCLTRIGRARRARHAVTADPDDLRRSASAFAEAARLVPRDDPEHRALLTEWGEALLARAQLPGGAAAAQRAVQVLRASLAETPRRDPRMSARRLLLGQALRTRYRYELDLADLREAEHELGQAARAAADPVEEARAWLERGDVQRALFARTSSMERLEWAVDSYRRSWLAARRAPGTLESSALVARAQHRKGEVLADMGRPGSALEAFRSAGEEWVGLPDRGGEEGARTGERIRELGGGES